MFIQEKRKHNEMAFSMSSNASKHFLSALGIDHTARDTVMVKLTGVPLKCCKLHPLQCCARLKLGIAKSHKMLIKQMLGILLLKFDFCSLMADIMYKGEIVQHVAPRKLAARLVYSLVPRLSPRTNKKWKGKGRAW